MNTNPFRTGFMTSEFWSMLLGIVAAVLVGKGVIGVNQVAGFVNAGTADIVNIISAVFSIIAIYRIVAQYIKSRTTIKTTILSGSTTAPVK